MLKPGIAASRSYIIFLFLLLGTMAWSQKGTQQLLQKQFKNKTFEAKVIKISDGDSMEVLYDKTPIKIRLAHIDCPELRGSQPFGKHAKKALSDLCFGQLVTVYGENYDRYGRLIAVIKNNEKQNVNAELLALGMAWHYKKYSKEGMYAELETAARKKQLGLWQDKNPIAPWDWRKQRKKMTAKQKHTVQPTKAAVHLNENKKTAS